MNAAKAKQLSIESRGDINRIGYRRAISEILSCITQSARKGQNKTNVVGNWRKWPTIQTHFQLQGYKVEIIEQGAGWDEMILEW
jgi:hypothetical protein